MPQTCPVCSSKAVRDEGEVARRCVNASCPAQVKERLAHFCSRSAMDIEGVGPSLIDQLVDEGLVRDAADLYGLKKEQLLTLEGIAEKSSLNIIEAIQASLDRNFESVLFSLGIRHVGKTTADVLARALGSMDRIRTASVEDLSKVEGIGHVIGSAIRDFMDNPNNRELLERLRKSGLKMEGKTLPKGPLSGKVFLFTGELASMARSEAEAAVEALGGKACPSVTKSTDYVVAGKDPGSKLAKARNMKKTILDEKAFLELIKKH